MSVSESNNSIRIRTTPLGSDKYVKINFTQNFDFLEILSLKIDQAQAYRKFCSDYGVIAGRVVCNKGVGVPNAKITVFIPISDEDKENPEIRALYPYESLEDTGSDGLKYNLLTRTAKVDDLCHTPIGSYPEKRRILDCDPWCEIQGKYYKYTTSTNNAGDYLIFGVPTGNQTVHMDVDLSDIGYLSQKPYDMIKQGSPTDLFESYNKFASGPNLGQLPQVKTQNKTINVLPFWGDVDQCLVGINRVDFDLNYNIETNAFFIGSIFGDSSKHSVNKTCRPRRTVGRLDQMITGPGKIEMIRRTPFGGTEVYTPIGETIDDDGTWVLQIPMNLEHKITNEFGDLIDSGSPEIGIATKAKYRFRIGMLDFRGFARVRARAKFLVPNYGDYSFSDTTPDFVTLNGRNMPNFADFTWNGIYTVKQFIGRYANRIESACRDNNFTGIKDVTESLGNNPFPFTTYDKNINPLFNILCFLLVYIFFPIILILNLLISGINSIISFLGIDEIKCVGFDCDTNTTFAPGCFNAASGQNVSACLDFSESCLNQYADCVQGKLAESLNIYSFYFANDWINGALFAFLFKYKLKKNGKSKFCNLNESRGTQYIYNLNCVGNDDSGCTEVLNTTNGLIYEDRDDYSLYYGAVIDNRYLYATDIYNLGSSKVCDLYGRPKIVEEIPSTSFAIPELIDTKDPVTNAVVERGIDDLLIDINCFRIYQTVNECKNTARYCEIDVDPDGSVQEPLTNDSLEDEGREIREDLICLNSGQCNLSLSNGDGGFLTDWNKYRVIYKDFKLGYTYPNAFFNESDKTNLLRSNNVNNSFYFYFGLLAGRTAIDKLVSKYFVACERKEPCPIRIKGIIENNKCLGGSFGSITASPEMGTPPYTYTWIKGSFDVNYLSNVICTNCTDTITGLKEGTYSVIVEDSVKQICVQTFYVTDPEPFNVVVDYTPYVCPGTNNGSISIVPMGGVPPYGIDWSPGFNIGLINTGNTNGNFYINNLAPTSNCTTSGVTNLSTTPFIGNQDFTASVVVPNIYSAYTQPTVDSNGDNLYDDINNVYIGDVIYDNVTLPDSHYFNGIYSATCSGAYDFDVSVGFEYDISSAAGSALVKIEYYFNVYDITNNLVSSDLVAYSNHYAQLYDTYLGYGSKHLASRYMNPGDYAIVQGYISITNYNSTNAPFTVNLRTTGGTFSSTQQIVNPYNCLSGATTASTYVAVVYDSAGQYGCLGISALTIDIAQSCGFSVNATPIQSDCQTNTGNTGNGIEKIEIINGGVPPFTYEFKSSSINFYKSGTTNYYSFEISNLKGNVTYDLKIVDSCGFVYNTTVSVPKSSLRGLHSYYYFDTACTYRYYIHAYVGNANNFSYTDGVPNPPYYSGQITGVGNVAIPNTHWHQLPPLDASFPIRKIQSGECNSCLSGVTFQIVSHYLVIERISLNATQDTINYTFTYSNCVIRTHTFTIEKNETYSAHIVYVDPGSINSTVSFSIKSSNCNDTLTNSFRP